MQAYKDTVVESGETPQSLPSLTSFTDEQLFFIAFGQVRELSDFLPSSWVQTMAHSKHIHEYWPQYGLLVNHYLATV